MREERGNAGDHILLRFDDAENLTGRYIHGPNVNQILASEDVSSPTVEGDVLWALTDHLGSVRDPAVYAPGTDTTSVVNHVVYDAFGRIVSESNSAVDFLYGFTGREPDTESDLQYNRARYYDAALGRWLSQDPIGFDAGDANLYRYVANSTNNVTDPSGLWDIPLMPWDTFPEQHFEDFFPPIPPSGPVIEEGLLDPMEYLDKELEDRIWKPFKDRLEKKGKERFKDWWYDREPKDWWDDPTVPLPPALPPDRKPPKPWKIRPKFDDGIGIEVERLSNCDCPKQSIRS